MPTPLSPPLATSYYRLAPLSAEHTGIIFELRSSEQVQQYLNRPLMRDWAEAKYFIEEITAGMQSGEFLYWVIYRQRAKTPIGTICLWQFNRERTQADLGYELLPDAQGQGVMTEVLPRIIAYARDTLELQLLQACTNRENTSSLRLLRSAGFTYLEDADFDEGMVVYGKYIKGLPAYLQRIGLPPLAQPNMVDLQRAHLFSVPFENLDIHRRLSISLRFEDVFRKLVHDRRGGFCYEQNSLFRWALLELGYEAHLVQAQVYSTKKKEYGPPFDHMAVWLETPAGPFLADVGYGNAPLAPIAIEDGAEVQGTAGRYCMERMESGRYQLSHKKGGQWIPDYMFDLQARRMEEYEPMALYHQTAAESPFTQKRLISLPRPEGGRVSISGNELKITAADGEQKVAVLEDEQAFQRALAQYFGFSLSSTGPA